MKYTKQELDFIKEMLKGKFDFIDFMMSAPDSIKEKFFID